MPQTSSLNTRGESQDSEHIEFIEGNDNIWDFTEEIFTAECISQLPVREAYIVQAKREGYNNREIGKVLRLSGERVRQLFKNALDSLKYFVTCGIDDVHSPRESKSRIKEAQASPSTHQDVEPVEGGDQHSFNLPDTKNSKEPAMKRVNAIRLGGFLGRAITQTVSQNKDFLNEIYGVLNCDRILQAFSDQGSPFKLAGQSRSQFNSIDLRFYQLRLVRCTWQKHLEIGQVILSLLLLPLAFAYQAIGGFRQSNPTIRRRPTMHLSATNVFKLFWAGYRKEHPRPPNFSCQR